MALSLVYIEKTLQSCEAYLLQSWAYIGIQPSTSSYFYGGFRRASRIYEIQSHREYPDYIPTPLKLRSGLT